MSCLTTLRLTSASSSAMRISRRASSMFSSVRVAWPRRVLKARWSFSWRFSNIDVSGYFSSESSVGQSSHRPEENSLFLLDLRPSQFDPVGSARVLNTTHAADQVERIPIQASVLDVRIID